MKEVYAPGVSSPRCVTRPAFARGRYWYPILRDVITLHPLPGEIRRPARARHFVGRAFDCGERSSREQATRGALLRWYGRAWLLTAVPLVSARSAAAGPCFSFSYEHRAQQSGSVFERKQEPMDMQLSRLLRKPGKRNGIGFC